MKKNAFGFTLIEVLLSVVVLSLMTTAITAMYVAGLNSSHAQDNGVLLDSTLRNEMEKTVAKSFVGITDDSHVETIAGTSYTFSTTVTLADLDGDAVPEATAKLVKIQIDEDPDRNLSVIVVNHEGKVGKL